MRNFYLIFTITIPLFLVSQEISQEYLDSLPPEIREDVLKRVDEKKDLEDKVYRSIDSSSEKDKELLPPKKYRIFGSDFFTTFQTSFMPVNNPNLDDSYVLDFGDVIGIQLIGQTDLDEKYLINREGSINIPDIGKLNIAGMKFGEVVSLIDTKVQQTYIGTKAYTTLLNIRDVSVLVSGDAYSPGIYTLSGNSNLLHALHVAGGISDHGSYRSIKLIRDNKIIDTLDLYDILISGTFNLKNRLKNGDVIFVDKRKNIILVEGAVKRPSKYELLDDQNLSDIIKYSNGLSIDADLSSIFLYRLLDGEVKSIPIVNINQFNNILAKDNDKVFIRKHNFRDVIIDGAVLMPGTYKMTENENINDLIQRAGGFTNTAYPKGAIYVNEHALEISSNASEILYRDFIDALLEVMQRNPNAGGSELTSLSTIAKELKDAAPNGRIIIDLFDETNQPTIQNNDYLFIPEYQPSIYIFGEVMNEGSLLYLEGEDIDYYFKEAAGFKETADINSIFILYPDGRTKKVSKTRNLFANESKNVDIYAGSVIYVPRKVDSTLSNQLTAQAYATILGNIGVSLASISVLKD